MAELIWSERAILDLESIFDYIAQDSALYARYTVQNIFKSREQLQEFPESGRHLPEFAEFPHRELIVGHYRVIYRYDNKNNRVNVIAIVHGSRLLKEDILGNQ